MYLISMRIEKKKNPLSVLMLFWKESRVNVEGKKESSIRVGGGRIFIRVRVHLQKNQYDRLLQVKLAVDASRIPV